MNLIILKINTDKSNNHNIRTYIADKEEVIIDFIGMMATDYDIEDVEDIIHRCVCQGNSMDIGYEANNIKKTNYRIKLIDDYNRNVSIEI